MAAQQIPSNDGGRRSKHSAAARSTYLKNGLGRRDAVMAKRLRGRHKRLLALAAFVALLTQRSAKRKADLEAAAEIEKSRHERIWSDVEEQHPNLGLGEDRSERRRHLVVFAAETAGGLIVAEGLGLPVSFEADTSVLTQTGMAFGVAIALALAFITVAEFVGKQNATHRDSEWHQQAELATDLTKLGPGLTMTTADRRAAAGGKIALGVLTAMATAVRGAPVLLNPAASANSVNIGLAFLGGTLCCAPAMVGYTLGRQRGTFAQSWRASYNCVRSAQSALARTEFIAGLLNAVAGFIIARYESEVNATRSELHGILSVACADVYRGLDGADDAEVIVEVDTWASQNDDPDIEPATFPRPVATNLTWTPYLIKGGKDAGAGTEGPP